MRSTDEEEGKGAHIIWHRETERDEPAAGAFASVALGTGSSMLAAGYALLSSGAADMGSTDWRRQMNHEFDSVLEARKWLENTGFRESLEDSNVWRKGKQTKYIVHRWNKTIVHGIATGES